MGLQRAGVFSDQEPAAQALASAAKAARRAETVITSGPRKDSTSKGRIENMVGMVEGLLRTVILSVQHHYNVTLDPDHPILGWAVRHTGWILTRYAMKDNGMTPYRLLRGKDYRGIVVEFAECVLFSLAGAQPKLARRWKKGHLARQAKQHG